MWNVIHIIITDFFSVFLSFLNDNFVIINHFRFWIKSRLHLFIQIFSVSFSSHCFSFFSSTWIVFIILFSFIGSKNYYIMRNFKFSKRKEKSLEGSEKDRMKKKKYWSTRFIFFLLFLKELNHAKKRQSFLLERFNQIRTLWMRLFVQPSLLHCSHDLHDENYCFQILVASIFMSKVCSFLQDTRQITDFFSPWLFLQESNNRQRD